jgi:hypothetical protein
LFSFFALLRLFAPYQDKNTQRGDCAKEKFELFRGVKSNLKAMVGLAAHPFQRRRGKGRQQITINNPDQ